MPSNNFQESNGHYPEGTPEEKLAKFIFREFCFPISSGLAAKQINISPNEIYDMLGMKTLNGVSGNSLSLGSVTPPFAHGGGLATSSKQKNPNAPKCKHIVTRKNTGNKEPCGKGVIVGSEFCRAHQPNEKSPAKLGGFVIEDDPVGKPTINIKKWSFAGDSYLIDSTRHYLAKAMPGYKTPVILGIYTPDQKTNYPLVDENGLITYRKLTHDEANDARFLDYTVPSESVAPKDIIIQNKTVESEMVVNSQKEESKNNGNIADFVNNLKLS